MVQTAESAASPPALAGAWDAIMGGFAARGLGQPRPALPKRLPDASRAFAAYAADELVRRCLRPLLAAPADRVEERLASVRPYFALLINAMRSAAAVEMSRMSKRRRERERKEMDGAPNAFARREAEARLGPVAAQAFLGGARTALLVKQAASDGEMAPADAARIESLLLDWALASAAVGYCLSEERPRGKRNAIALAFRSEDSADAAYYAAKAAGVINPAQCPSAVRSYEASKEDLLLADLAARGAAEIQRSQEAALAG